MAASTIQSHVAFQNALATARDRVLNIYDRFNGNETSLFSTETMKTLYEIYNEAFGDKLQEVEGSYVVTHLQQDELMEKKYFVVAPVVCGVTRYTFKKKDFINLTFPTSFRRKYGEFLFNLYYIDRPMHASGVVDQGAIRNTMIRLYVDMFEHQLCHLLSIQMGYMNSDAWPQALLANPVTPDSFCRVHGDGVNLERILMWTFNGGHTADVYHPFFIGRSQSLPDIVFLHSSNSCYADSLFMVILFFPELFRHINVDVFSQSYRTVVPTVDPIGGKPSKHFPAAKVPILVDRVKNLLKDCYFEMYVRVGRPDLRVEKGETIRSKRDELIQMFAIVTQGIQVGAMASSWTLYSKIAEMFPNLEYNQFVVEDGGVSNGISTATTNIRSYIAGLKNNKNIGKIVFDTGNMPPMLIFTQSIYIEKLGDEVDHRGDRIFPLVVEHTGVTVSYDLVAVIYAQGVRNDLFTNVDETRENRETGSHYISRIKIDGVWYEYDDINKHNNFLFPLGGTYEGSKEFDLLNCVLSPSTGQYTVPEMMFFKRRD